MIEIGFELAYQVGMQYVFEETTCIKSIPMIGSKTIIAAIISDKGIAIVGNRIETLSLFTTATYLS